jgi:hypothetical protein
MVNGHVRRGIGVVLPTDVFGQLLKSVGSQVLIAFKHHVLEQMREPAAPIGIILGPDVVPNLDCNRWTGMVFDRVNLQPILQGTMIERQLLHLGFGLSRKTGSGQGQEGRKKNEKPASAHRAQTLGSDPLSTTSFALLGVLQSVSGGRGCV